MATNKTLNLSLQSILKKDKLTRINFLDWFKNLRTVLKQERKLYIFDQLLPEEPAATTLRAHKDTYKKHIDDSLDMGCLMFATMTPELQKDLEHMEAYEMAAHPKEMF